MPNFLFDFLVGALAVWRMSSMLNHEAGPFDVFTRLRTAIGVKHGDGMVGDVFPDTYLGGMFSCIWCLSMNLAIVWAVLLILCEQLTTWMALPFAVSAVAILVERIAHR